MNAVIHLGAIVGDPACAYDEENARQTNHLALSALASACRGARVSRLLFASTCSVYGASPSLVDETSPLDPISLYARTKQDAEKLLLAYHDDSFHPTVMRVGTAFGWSHRPRFDLVVNLLTARALFDRSIVIYNGSQWRPFVHVKDVARACCALLQAPLAKVSGQTFNVGSSDMNHQLGEIGDILRCTAPAVKITHEFNPDRRNYRVSFDKIERSLGFRCGVSLQEGICEMQTALEQGLVDDYRLPIYHNHRFMAASGKAWAARGDIVLATSETTASDRARTDGVGASA
jgi:nucleoside-diphosphate-sugar epimerase